MPVISSDRGVASVPVIHSYYERRDIVPVKEVWPLSVLVKEVCQSLQKGCVASVPVSQFKCRR